MAYPILYSLLCAVVPLLLWRLILAVLALVAMLRTDKYVSIKAKGLSFEIQTSRIAEPQKKPPP